MSKGLVRRSGLVLAMTAFMGLLGVSEAAGQILAVGGHISMNQDIGDGSTWGVGARGHLSLPLTGITLQGTADFFSPDCGPLECDLREIGLNLLWSLPVPWLANPYFGAGAAIQNAGGEWELGGDSDYGLNFLAGLVLQGPAFTRFQPFGEVKYQMMQDFDSQTVFSFGILFNLIQ